MRAILLAISAFLCRSYSFSGGGFSSAPNPSNSSSSDSSRTRLRVIIEQCNVSSTGLKT
ncbi:hypothetical protein M758_N019000 [Ceratodon purpureus]|nr:hypothetical protein M758_N019000 [Ceratodon purpureus]